MPLKIADCKGFLSDKRARNVIVAIGCALILLLFFSTLTPQHDKEVVQAEDTSAIERELEQRLEELIGGISGVVSPTVMVTLDSTSQRVYARDSRNGTSSSQKDGSTTASGDNESSIVLISSGSDKSALEESTVLPKVRGVAVICGGAEDPSVKEKVVNVIASVLDISSSRVCVTY